MSDELIHNCQLICKPRSFQRLVLDWYQAYGRKQLPWQLNPTPYHVWVSEVMLQQTQVSTVIRYFERFSQSFPDIDALAQASQDDVLAVWSGLGYYSRARHLHKTAQIIAQQYGGVFPEDLDELMSLPGIGRSTAGAIRALAMNKPAAILDGNVKRVLARVFNIEGWPGQTAVAKQLWQISEAFTSDLQPRAFVQGMMDLGAMVCTKKQPECSTCPLKDVCQAYRLQKQDVLPAQKPSKKRPIRHRHMLILLDDNQVLLEKRPPAGIWGGLWSLPELNYSSDINEIEGYISHSMGYQCLAIDALKQFKHQFTHYELVIYPIIAQVNPRQYKVAESSTIWQPINQVNVGLPQPVKQLLQQLKDQYYG